MLFVKNPCVLDHYQLRRKTCQDCSGWKAPSIWMLDWMDRCC